MTVQVGGWEDDIVDSYQWTSVDMFPGGTYTTYALSNALCSAQSSSNCGKGGLWSPTGAQTGVGLRIDYEPAIDFTTSSGLYATGKIYAQNLNMGISGSDVTAPNASISAVDIGNVTLPNGNMLDLEVGALALGADDQQQVFTTGSTTVGDDAIDTWIFPGYLYNQSITNSYSFSLHIGSTAFDYPGSLIFGGYDKGRAIGPGTSWGDDPPQLLDIELGVETGGSPFGFDSKDSLLLINTSSPGQLAVQPEGLVPYLHLPKQTCDNLAKYLPVTLDSSGYYLWDTSDPAYTNITTSAAYLGFKFPPATGGTKDIIIKVPFQLLVLNLTTQASSKPGLTPYFPCMPYEPTDGTYLLGRAFLQAAFWGRNWNQHVSWLAQAPGPGSSRLGLGHQPTDIQDEDTNLDFYEGGTYFTDSWSEYWSPLPGGTSDETVSGASGSNSGATLSVGAKAGIGVGAAAVGVGLFALLAFFIFRSRKNSKDSASEQESFVAAHHGDEAKATPQPHHAQPQQVQYGQQQQQVPYDQQQAQYNDHISPVNQQPQYHAQSSYNQQPPYPQQQHPGYQPSGFADEAYAPQKSGYPAQHQSIPLAELTGTIRSPAQELPAHEPSELEAPGPKFVRQPSR